MDAFAVSLGAGAAGQLRHPRPAVRLAFHLGLFQALMPIAGWYLGSRAAALVASVDHIIALLLLGFVGSRMVRSGIAGESTTKRADPSKGLTLVAVSIATSIDAFAIGLSLAVLGVAIWYPSAVIGIVTASFSLVGIALGGRLGQRLGSWAEVLGGLLLIAIGLRIFLQHAFNHGVFAR